MSGMNKMANTRKSERSEGRTARVPFGGFRLRTQLSKEDMLGFKKRRMVTRWFNDEPGRLERALAGGYNFVKPEYATSLGQGALHGDGNDPESNARVSMVVNRGEPIIRAYLMEISKKFHDEDKAAKEKVNAQVDEALAIGGSRGSELENEYKPK
jgi:hypothetical protein